MKRSPSIVLIAGLLALLGFTLLASRSPSGPETRPIASTAATLFLAGLSVVVARAVWKLASNALRLFTAWALCYVALGATVQVVSLHEPLVHVAIWASVVSAVLATVGLHLRYVLRPTV